MSNLADMMWQKKINFFQANMRHHSKQDRTSLTLIRLLSNEYPGEMYELTYHPWIRVKYHP